MKFRTTVPIPKQAHYQIDYNSELLLLGSCFSDHIGVKFRAYQFKATCNPLGVLFHPLAIESFLTRAINETYYTPSDLWQNGDMFGSLEAHSQFNGNDASLVVSQLNKALTSTRSSLETASHMVLTLGTAWVYRHIASDTVVANCHKIPQNQFLKELLSIDEIRQSLEAIIILVKSINPKMRCIVTVSPVRHLKDGFAENTRSKAHLVAAVHEVVYSNKDCFYFPAFELLLDELRDYRFFKADMVHPSEQAVDYVWQRFRDTWFTKDTQALYGEVNRFKLSLEHKTFNPNSEAHQAFLKSLEQKRQELAKRISGFNL